MTDGRPPLEVARAATLNNKLQLEAVMVFEIEAKHLSEHPEPSLSFSLALQPVSWRSDSEGITSAYPLRVTIEHVEEDSRTPLAELRVVMAVRSRFRSELTTDDELAIEHYVGITGWMHAWPYLRAEIQSLSTRLGFPPLLLPVLLAGQTANIPVVRQEPHDQLTASKMDDEAPRP